MGDARQIEMLRAKVMASMPLRKSQQQTTLVALEEREEGELSAEDDEPMGIYAAAVPRKSVPNLEARASRKEKPVISAASKAEVAQPMTQVSIVNKSQLLNVFSAPAPPLASLQGPMQVRNPEIASGPKLKVEFLPTDAGLAKHQGAHVQIQGNSFRGQLNLSVNKITEAAPAALGQSELPVLDHPVTHDRKRGRSREAIMVPVTQTKAVAPWVASPLVGAIASSSGLHSSQVAPASVSGVRSEVDSFLASLHLPVVPASSTPFAEEKFVIKFDSDSDSEGEQQGNRSTHGQFSGHQSIGLLSQSPADMRSEIDRMKKQIAVMERNKGKANSNSHLTSQSTSLSKVTGSRTGMADLQSLRQQIAAKENELLERRQRLAVPSAMTTPRLPVGKVLEHQNADIAKVGDGQTRLASVVRHPDSGLSNKDGVLLKNAQSMCSNSSGLQVVGDTMSGVLPVPQESECEHALGLNDENPSSTSHQTNVLVSDASAQPAISSIGTLVELPVGNSVETLIHVEQSKQAHSTPSSVVLNKPTSSSPIRRIVPSFSVKSSIFSPITTVTQSSYDTATSINPPGYALWPPLPQLQAGTSQLEPSGMHGPIWSIDPGGENRMQLLRQMQEEEEAVDKALEEAQLRRRQCEVSERDARRLYQDAQSALASANALCDALLHQRKLLNAQLRAAELHMLQPPPFAMPTDRRLSYDRHPQLTEPVKFPSAAWTNQQQLPGGMAFGSRVHVRGNQRQNGGNISTRIEKLPDDRSQKPVMLSTGMEKIDPDEIGAAPNSKVETVQGLGFDNQPTYEEQLQPSDREQKSAVSDLDKHIFASLSVHSAGKECPMNKEKLSTSEIMRTSLGEESQTIMERHAAERTIAPLQKDTISLAPGHHFAKTDGIGLRMILQHGSTGIPAGDEAMMMASSPSVRLTAVCDTDEDQIDARHSRVEVCFPVECPESVVDGHNVDDCEQTTMLPSSVLYGISYLCLEKPSEEHFEWMGTSLTTSMSLGKYESPLSMFRSYRLSPQFGLAWHYSVESKTWSHGIDIWKPLCKFEHRGKCNNDACLGQHVADYTLGHTGLLSQELSVPIYQIGPNILRPDQMDLCSRVRCLLRFQPKVVSFSSSLLSPALCRSLLPDVPCLLTATVEDSSITHAAEESRRYIGDAGYSQEVAEYEEGSNVGLWGWREQALYILSRALEANPTVVVLWVVYIGLFYNKESNIGTDDMFHHAVGFNPNSYELWLLFIHSRPKLGDCLDAYKLALQSLCSLEENDQEEQSACLLDLALQMLNCMCVSSQTSLLHGWVDALADPKVSNRGLLALLTPNDSCVLWVGCAYAVAFGELPHEFVRRLGCNQLLPFELNWDRRSEVQEGSGARVIKLLNAGMNCLVGTAHQRSQHALAVNHVQCLALYHGLNQALMMAHRQWEMHPSCVELVLLVARMEGKTGGVAIFEKALQHWPHHQVGLQQLWNQYAVHVLQWGGKSSALRVLYQCASRATAVNVSASWELRQDSKVRDALEFIAENNMSNGSFGSIGCDAVFAWLNLALFEVLSGDRGHAQAAVERSMKASISSEDVRHCWREMAALTVLGDVDNVRQPNHVLDLLDRCCVETDVLWKLTPLSSKVSKNISKHRLRSFIEFLLGPSPVDYSVVNSFVHTFIAKGLRLGKLTSGLVEGVLAVMPGNVEVVLPLCRLLRHEPTSIQELAAVIWASSIILSTLLQACPQAPERDWVEAGQLLAHLGDKSSLQEFYQHALVVYPFSAALQCSLSELQQSHVDRTVAVEDTLLEGVPIC
ncbi:unnamed protein product [Sphagnum jensenii]|uniref:Putative zinc-finger domain-containing protein n=1 Tax=Sphagnum jensenii TaxID=128206 RepID=A0ABP0XAH0_9BRYO